MTSTWLWFCPKTRIIPRTILSCLPMRWRLAAKQFSLANADNQFSAPWRHGARFPLTRVLLESDTVSTPSFRLLTFGAPQIHRPKTKVVFIPLSVAMGVISLRTRIFIFESVSVFILDEANQNLQWNPQNSNWFAYFQTAHNSNKTKKDTFSCYQQKTCKPRKKTPIRRNQSPGKNLDDCMCAHLGIQWSLEWSYVGEFHEAALVCVTNYFFQKPSQNSFQKYFLNWFDIEWFILNKFYGLFRILAEIFDNFKKIMIGRFVM